MVAEIYCYGGIDIYRDVFNAIAMVNGDKSFIKGLLTVGMIVGSFWGVITMVGGDLIRPFISWLIPMTIIQTVFLTPTSTVKLIDVVQAGQHATVSNVPYGLVLIAGMLSRVSHNITQKVETFFTIPGDLKYSKTGGIFAANLLANQKIMVIQDENFAENMRSFICQCVLYDVALGRKYTIKDLRNTPNIWGLISQNASPARSFIWKDGRGQGNIITCQAGVTKFNEAWGSAIDQTACAMGAQFYSYKDSSSSTSVGGVGGSAAASRGRATDRCRYPLARQEFLKFLPLHYGAMTTISGGNATELLRQQMMISALVDAQDHASVMAGNASNFAARKAYLQQRSSYETIGKLASDTLPIMRAVLELICYCLFLFIMPILVLPMGYRVLVSWIQTVVWLALWPPLYAILHLIMVSAIAMKTKPFIGFPDLNGITLASSLGVQNISSDMAAMAGYLSMSIPFICIAIVKGLSSFMHMASSLGSVSQGAATGASQEVLTGNHVLGNISMDNHSFGGVSMLNQSYDAGLSSGSTSLHEGHTSITTSADGGKIATIEQSHAPLSIDFASGKVNSKRMAANRDLSISQSQSRSVEKSIGSAFEQTGNLGQHLSSATSIQAGWTEQQQQESAKAFQKLNNEVSRFAQNNDISTGKAAQILAQVGTPGMNLFGTGASTQVSSSSEERELIQRAKDFAQQTQLDQTARVAEQAIQHLSKHSSDERVQSYVKSMQASFTKAARDGEAAQKHFESSQRLNKEADKIESQSATFNRNHTDRFIRWLADQPATYGLDEKIGYREAVAMMSHKPEEIEAYANRYIQENMQEMSLGMSESSMKQDYGKIELPLSVDRSVVDQLDQQAKTKITRDIASKAEGIENRVQGKIEETSKDYAEEAVKMTKDSVALKKQYHHEKEKVGIEEAVEQGLDALHKGIHKAAVRIDETDRYVIEHPEVLLTPGLSNNHPDTVSSVEAKNMKGHVESKIKEAEKLEKEKLAKDPPVLKAPYHQKTSVEERARHSAVVVGEEGVKTIEAAEKGMHYDIKHMETIMIPSLLANYPDTLTLVRGNNGERHSESTISASTPEPPRKVVQVKQVVKAAEEKSINPTQRPKKDTSSKES